MIKIGDTTILVGDCRKVLRTLPDKSIDCCVTSPPYFNLRDYNVDSQIGLESTPQEFIKELVSVFREIKRVLKDTGTLWVNIGDTYSGHKQGDTETNKNPNAVTSSFTEKPCTLKSKNLIGIPWRVAFALQELGYILRQDIVWAKPNPLPEPVKDRCVKAHEYIFLFSKFPKYHFDYKAIQEPCKYPGDLGILRGKVVDGSMASQHSESITKRVAGGIDSRTAGPNYRRKRSVWTVRPSQYPEAHFAVFPPELIRPCIKAGCPKGGTVLDPFAGSGTTAQVAQEEGCKSIMVELNPDYAKLIKRRVSQQHFEL